MNSRKIRFLLWSGCLGGVVLFAGDMLYYGGWGPAQLSVIPKIMAHVASWRLHLGSLTGPVGGGLELLGMLGLWFCCRRAAPRLAAVMLAGFYVTDPFYCPAAWNLWPAGVRPPELRRKQRRVGPDV